jgi:membrane protein YdbS with pleckstrin-like domain
MSDGGDERARAPEATGPGPETETKSAVVRRSKSVDRSPDTRETAEFGERVSRATAAIRDRERRLDPEKLVEYTTDRRDLDPKVRVRWGITMSVGVAVLTVVLTGLVSAAGGPAVLGVLVLAVLFGLGAGLVVLRYRVWIYQVREDSLYLERGVLVNRRTHVPYVRIQHLDTSRGPLERWLGLSTLVVYTAGSRGADISIPGLEPAEARDLQQRVKRLAIEAEGDDAL